MKSEVEVRTKGSFVSAPTENPNTDLPVKSPGSVKTRWWRTGIKVTRSRPVRYLVILTNIATAVALIFYFPEVLGEYTTCSAVWLLIAAVLGIINDTTDLTRWVLEDLAKLFRRKVLPFVFSSTKKLEAMSKNVSDLLS